MSIRSLPLSFECKSSLGDGAEVLILANSCCFFLDYEKHQQVQREIAESWLPFKGPQGSQPPGLRSTIGHAL